MEAPCNNCPFNKSGPGLKLRRSLEPGRWREILDGLRNEATFHCHKTTGEDDEGEAVVTAKSLLCAGALEWQAEHGISSNYQRVCEALDYFARKRIERAKGQSDVAQR